MKDFDPAEAFEFNYRISPLICDRELNYGPVRTIRLSHI